MTQTSFPRIPKFYIFATLGLLLPIFILVMVFFAAKSDAETDRKYDQLQVELEARTALKKQQEAQQENSLSSAKQPEL